MGFVNHVKFWSDVRNPRLDEEAAPSLGGVHLGKEEAIYSDPAEFFGRTLVTRSMAEALEAVVDALLGRGGNRLIVLQSLFGGGKTHTLLTIYHAFRSPTALLKAKAEDGDTKERLQRLAKELSGLGGVRVVVLDGHFSELAPTPVNPLVIPGGHRVQTLWGSLAHQLGRFGEVRENDERLLAPPVDVIVRLIGEEPVLILVDELAYYVVNLKSSGDPGLQKHGDQVLSFVEALAKAVELSRRSALIVSMPVEARGGRPEVEDRYKSQPDVVIGLYRSVSRVASKNVLPVAPSDMANVLKVRIFESVDDKAAKAVSSSLAKQYGAEENRGIFGQDAVRKASEVVRTYPFHPSYIETLVDIVDKHESLEKTRDAIRITRKVVRRLVNADTFPEIVMPFHIDVEDREIRGKLLSHDLYGQYETVVDEDIIRKTKDYERPELAKTVAKTVFIKTFVYAGMKHQGYPDEHEVVLSSFEPSMAGALGLEPKDYLDALEWASKELYYLLSEGGRYWFTYLASPIRRVHMVARTVGDDEALEKVKEYAQNLLTKPRRDRRGEATKTPFKAVSSLVLTGPKPVDHDSRDYILVVVLSSLKNIEIEKIIYETPSGGTRRHANTVYIIYPRDSNRVAQMLGSAKSLIACYMVREELGSMYKDSDREVRDVMRKKLEKYCFGTNGVEDKLVEDIINGLNSVAYPSFDERNTFKLADSSAADTIMETAARALKSVRPQKLYEELGFEELEYMLSQVGIGLSEGGSARSVSDIVDYFYSNPRLPMVGEETIKGALIDGVKGLRIGVRSPGDLFFKKIHECRSRQECSPPAGAEEGKAPRGLGPYDEVLPWRMALQEQLDDLKKEEKEERVAGGIRRVWHAFYIDGKLVPVAEALKDYDLETLRDNPLVRVAEFVEEGVDVRLDRYEITASPGEEAIVTAVVERVGGFEGDLSLKATGGEPSSNALSIDDARPSATIDWKIRAPEEPGTYSYEMRVANSAGEVLKTAVLKVIVEPKGGKRFEGVPPKGIKLSMIEVKVPTFNFSPLRTIDSKFASACEVEEAGLELEAERAGRRPKVALKLNDAALDDVKANFMQIAQRYGMFVKDVRYWIRLRPRSGKYIVAPEFTEDEAEKVKGYMTYHVFEEG